LTNKFWHNSGQGKKGRFFFSLKAPSLRTWEQVNATKKKKESRRFANEESKWSGAQRERQRMAKWKAERRKRFTSILKKQPWREDNGKLVHRGSKKPRGELGKIKTQSKKLELKGARNLCG